MDRAERKSTPHKDVVAAVLNSYAHGSTIKQAAASANVDFDTADKIIRDAIAAQEQ